MLNLITTTPLDYEQDKHSYTVTILASDGEQASPEPLKLHIQLVNVDDNPPEFEMASYEWSLYENSEYFSLNVSAADPDQIGDITYGIIQLSSDILITIDSYTGQLFSSGPFDYESIPGSINFSITAKDEVGHVAVAPAVLVLMDVNEFPSSVWKKYLQCQCS